MEARRILYKSIFKYEDHNETLTYEERGTLTQDQEQFIIAFKVNNERIEIHHSDSYVTLKHGPALLAFSLHEPMTSPYPLAHGVVDLTGKVISLKSREDSLHFVYELYDHEVLLSTVYLMVRLLPVEEVVA